MSKFLINGGNKLFGELEISAAKNSYLTLLAASILVDGEVILHRYPKFSDTENMCEILKHIGSKIAKQNKSLVTSIRIIIARQPRRKWPPFSCDFVRGIGGFRENDYFCRRKVF